MTFLFDGDCAFCSKSAGWLRSVRLAPVVEITPWQFVDDLEARGITLDEVNAAVVLDLGGRHLSGVDAIGYVLRTSSWRVVRIAGFVLQRPPVHTIAWPIYRWIAKNRHRMPGGTPECSLEKRPRPPA